MTCRFGWRRVGSFRGLPKIAHPAITIERVLINTVALSGSEQQCVATPATFPGRRRLEMFAGSTRSTRHRIRRSTSCHSTDHDVILDTVVAVSDPCALRWDRRPRTQRRRTEYITRFPLLCSNAEASLMVPPRDRLGCNRTFHSAMLPCMRHV